MGTNLYYYSERGMVDSILHAMYKDNSVSEEIVKQIKDKEGKSILCGKSIKDISIFNEFSFGRRGFGDPDLIIRVDLDKGEPILFFIEAKVGTYKESATEPIGNYRKDKNHCYTSNINFQLRLRRRFVDAFFLNKGVKYCDVVAKDNRDKGYDFTDRKLSKDKKNLIKFITDIILKGIKPSNIYYVSMTSDEDNPYKNDYNLPFKKGEDGYEKLAYILYKDVIEKLDLESKEMFDNASRLAR